MDKKVAKELETIKNIIVATVPVEQIWLFGSYAYGTPTADSDYDFYVLLKDDSPIKPLEAMDAVEQNLIHCGIKTPTDIHANYKKRFEARSALPTMERKIVREGVLLYDQ